MDSVYFYTVYIKKNFITVSFMHGAHEIGQRGVFGRTAVREVPDS